MYDDDIFTELTLLPVCSCGYVFREGIELKCGVEVINNNEPLKVRTNTFTPSQCPNCKRFISSVKVNRFVNDCEQEELSYDV